MSRPCVGCGGEKPAGTGFRYCDGCRPSPEDVARHGAYRPRHAPCKGCGKPKPEGVGLHYCHACRPISSQLERPTECVGCGKPFESTRRGLGWSRFCTRECAYDARRRRTRSIGDVWADAISAHLLYLRAGGRRKETLRLRRHYLERLAVAVHPTGPWDVSKVQIIEYLTAVEWAPETLKSARSAVRTFYLWGEDEGHIERSPAYRLPAVRVPSGVPHPTPDSIFTAAFSAAGEREQLMLMLARYAGLRRAEIAKVHTRDIFNGALRVRGKGGVTRSVPLVGDLATRLNQLPKGWAFPGRDDGHLSPGYVGTVLKRLLGEGWSGHSLRHAFASKSYAGTRDLRAVQTLLGHSRPETTARYTAVPDGALLAAVQAAAS